MTTTTERRGTRVLRERHRSQVLDLLRTHGPLSRTDLAERLSLTRSALTPMVADLIDEGLLSELGPSEDRAGRRPTARGRPRVLVGCDPGAARVVAAQIGARWARVVLADAAGEILRTTSVDAAAEPPEAVVGRVVEAARSLVADGDGPPLASAGVCVPGAVDTSSGTVVRSDVLGWTDVPLGPMVADRLGTPVQVQDVTQAATLAEARFGVAAGAEDVVVLDYGARIGAGLVVGGRLHRGAHGLAGSIGHAPVWGDATPCRCGRVGCLEAVAGMRAMVPTPSGHGLGDEVAAFEAMVGRVRAGEPATTAAVHDVLERAAHLGTSLAALVDPEVVVVSGLVAGYPDLAAHLCERIEALAGPDGGPKFALRLSTLGIDAWVRGAILVALRALDPAGSAAVAGR